MVIHEQLFQYNYLHPVYQVVVMTVQLVSVLVELVRPYLGYYGNLSEKVDSHFSYQSSQIFSDSCAIGILDGQLDSPDTNNPVPVFQPRNLPASAGAFCLHDSLYSIDD